MPFLESAVSMVAGHLPKAISPRVHAIMDYAIAGTFIVVGAKSWRHHKSAAISSFLAAGGIVALAAATDYPGGFGRLSFSTHLKIDTARSGVLGSMPNFVGFGGSWPAWFFRTQAMAMMTVAALTRRENRDEDRQITRAA